MRRPRPGLRGGRVVSDVRHFLDLETFDSTTLRRTIDRARALKGRNAVRPLVGKTLAAIFESPSTRTRVSFEVAMRELGGETISLMPGDMQLGRGESVEDTARVLSRYVDALALRARSHDTLLALAEAAEVPVINALTDRSHPCQLVADVLTYEEHRGPIAGRTVAWLGDGNNMAATWIQMAALCGFSLRLACPAACAPAPSVVAWAVARGADVQVGTCVERTVAGADCVVTDSWVSLHDDPARKETAAFEPYRVDEAVMALAAPDALFMHCLPAKRGQEVTDAVLDGPQSVVLDEAANRVPAQKAILLWCLDGG